MKINWIVESTPFKENIEGLRQAVKKQGHTLHEVKYVPFFKNQNLPDIPEGELSVFYGSLNLARTARKKYIGGVWCDLAKLRCSSYYPYFGKYLLNSPYCMFPFGDYKNLKPYLFKTFGRELNIFLRPDSGYKIFTGGLIAEQESISHFLANQVVFDNEIVIASEPANISREWRLVVCDKKIVASSQYQKNGLLDTQEGCPMHVYNFAEEAIKLWQPEICFVIDIAESNDLFVLELNSFSCSGFYDCNLDDIVFYASLAAEKEFRELAE